MAPRVLFIGLGNMGRGMSTNMAEKGPLGGQPLMLYNRSTARSTALSAKLGPGKAEVIESLADGVAKADIIFTCLANDEAVQETFATALQGNVAGKLFVECSTIHPDAIEILAKDVIAHDAEFLAAPVFGAPAVADAGKLIGVLAGPKAVVDKAKPYFEGVTSRTIIDMSDEPYSKSSTLKLIGNSFILNMVEQLAEGHVLAEKSGVDNKYLHRWLEEMLPGIYVAYSNRMLTGDYYKREEPLFAVGLARKDARHMFSLGQEAGVKLHNIETVDKHFASLEQMTGPTKGDLAGVYGAARVEAGLPYKNDAH